MDPIYKFHDLNIVCLERAEFYQSGPIFSFTWVVIWFGVWLRCGTHIRLGLLELGLSASARVDNEIVTAAAVCQTGNSAIVVNVSGMQLMVMVYIGIRCCSL